LIHFYKRLRSDIIAPIAGVEHPDDGSSLDNEG